MPKFKENPNPFMKKYNSSEGKHAKPSPEKFFRGLRGILGGRKKGRSFISRIFDPGGFHEKGGILENVPKPFGHLRGEKGIGGWKRGGLSETLSGTGITGHKLGRGDHSIGNVVADASKRLTDVRKKFGGKFF